MNFLQKRLPMMLIGLVVVGSAFADGSGSKRLQSFNAAIVARGTNPR